MLLNTNAPIKFMKLCSCSGYAKGPVGASIRTKFQRIFSLFLSTVYPKEDFFKAAEKRKKLKLFDSARARRDVEERGGGGGGAPRAILFRLPYPANGLGLK